MCAKIGKPKENAPYEGAGWLAHAETWAFCYEATEGYHMLNNDTNPHAAAQAAVARILAGIQVVITDDISQYSEIIQPLNDALARGGAYAAHKAYLALRNTQHIWLRDIEASEDLYPEVYDPEIFTEDDLAKIHEFEDSDFGQAEAMIYMYRNRLRYVVGLEWIIWTGLRWELDGQSAAVQFGMVNARVRLKAANWALEQVESGAKEQQDRAIARIRSAASRRNISSVKRALEAAATMPYFVTHAKELDRDDYKLGVKNGVVDLRTGELIPPRPDDLISKRSPVAYYPDAPAPRWEQFLREVFQGNEALIEYVQRCVGYSLTGDNSEQCFWVAFGHGANGKGTFANVLKSLLGEYGSAVEFKTFLHGGGSQVGDDIAPLRGVRLVVASESEQGRRLNEAMIKQVTGGDEVRVRFLHGRYFTFTPQFKIWLQTNHKPIIIGTDKGIWRRVRMLPFMAHFDEKSKDMQLGAKLEAELSGILAWAVRGAIEWQLRGLDMPEEVAAATKAYQDEMDTLGSWLADRTVVGEQYRSSLGQVYDDYKSYMQDSGLYVMPKPSFGRAMEERGYEKHRSNGVWWWRNFGLIGQ